MKKHLKVLLVILFILALMAAMIGHISTAQKPPVKPPNPGWHPTATPAWSNPFESPLQMEYNSEMENTVYFPVMEVQREQ